MFTVELGSEVESKITGIRGVVTSRSENLYGCNRYYVQPRADSEMKVPEGWWVDELDLLVIQQLVNRVPTSTGDPMSKVC